MLRDLLRAFDGGSQHRLLLTCRETFVAHDNGLLKFDTVQIRPFAAQDLKMQRLRLLQDWSSKQGGAQQLEITAETTKHLEAAQELAAGNAGLLTAMVDLTLGALGDEKPLAPIKAFQEDMRRYLLQGVEPKQSRAGDWLQEKAIHAKLAALSEAELQLLRSSCLVDLPVPCEVWDQLGNQWEGASIERLHGFGLWDRLPDPAKFDRRASAINALVRPLVEPPTAKDSGYLSGIVLQALDGMWPAASCPARCDVLMSQLAVSVGDLKIIQERSRGSLQWLANENNYLVGAPLARDILAMSHDIPDDAFRYAVKLIRANVETNRETRECEGYFKKLLARLPESNDKKSATHYGGVLLDLANLQVQLGSVVEAERNLSKAAEVFEQFEVFRDKAIAIGDIARIKVSRGEVDEALLLHDERLKVFESLGDQRSRAVCLGDIARIKVSRGEVDEALLLHDERLKVFESLGDQRSRAVCLGDIARIKVSRGEVDEALLLHDEMLKVFESLGDQRERAVCLGDIARIKVDRGEVDEALLLHDEMLKVFESLGDQRSRAVCLGDIARIKVSRGEVDEALLLHDERLKVFESLGDQRSRAVCLRDIARIKVSRGEVDEALLLHDERLKVFESLGDQRERAVCLGDIARIKVSRGEVDEALLLHDEMLKVFESLGDQRERAVCLGDIARIKVDRGEVDEALLLHDEMLKVFESLGDQRSRAVCLGDIARIKVSRGEVDEALLLHDERLKVFESLGDQRSRAVCLGDIARIKVSRGEVDEALLLHDERLVVSRSLGDQDGIANAQFDRAQILIKQSELQAAVEAAAESFVILQKIGRVDGLMAVGNLLGQLLLAIGDRGNAQVVLGVAVGAAETLGQVDIAEHLRELLLQCEGVGSE